MRSAGQMACIGVLITLLGSAAEAGDSDRPPCSLDEAIQSIEIQSLELNGRIAAAKLPLLRRIERLDEKDLFARPSGGSLTPAEQSELQKLRFQILQLDAYRIPMSGYLREAKAISKLREVAYSSSQGDPDAENDPDHFYLTVLTLLRRALPKDGPSTQDGPPTFTASPAECTVDTALHFYEQSMLRHIGEMSGFDPAMKRLTAIARKHKLDMAHDGWIERVEKDKKVARVDIETVARGLAMRQYVSDMENLKRLNQIMLLAYESDMDDVNHARNEEQLGKMGMSFSGKIKRDPKAQAVANVKNMIAQEIADEDQGQGSSK